MTDISQHIAGRPVGPFQPGYLIASVLASWAVLVAALAYGGVFDVPPDEPALPSLLAIAVPVGLFAAAMTASKDLRAWVLGLDPVLLTEMQAWRILGGTFLAVYAFGLLPGLFAWPGGLGDVAVGIAAPFIAWRLRREPEFLGSARFRLFHYAGLADFVVAVTAGIATRNTIPGLMENVTSDALGQLPLVMIPALIVPAFIILHAIVLMQSFAQNRTG